MSVVIVIEYQIALSDRDEFHNWVHEVQSKNITQKGYLGTKVLSSKEDEDTTYVLLQFDKQEHATAWQNSQSCRLLLDTQEEKWKGKRRETVVNWGEFWFQEEVPKWKQMIISFITVFTLSQVVGFVLNLVMKDFAAAHPTLTVMLNIALVVIMLVTFAMPFMMSVFHNWLYVSNSKKNK